jgi:hypothetical protein
MEGVLTSLLSVSAILAVFCGAAHTNNGKGAYSRPAVVAQWSGPGAQPAPTRPTRPPAPTDDPEEGH